MASRFGSHIKVWFLLVPVLAIAVMPAIPERKLFEVPEAEVDEMRSLVQERMENVHPELTVPLAVELGVGPNWRDLE